jgi:hypothetical protein
MHLNRGERKLIGNACGLDNRTTRPRGAVAEEFAERSMTATLGHYSAEAGEMLADGARQNCALGARPTEIAEAGHQARHVGLAHG